MIAGWRSSVARGAHNPEVAGSNPAPATKAGSLPGVRSLGRASLPHWHRSSKHTKRWECRCWRAPPTGAGVRFPGYTRKAWHGGARRGVAWHGKARRGEVRHGSVAQLVEQLLCTQSVTGSNPVGSTRGRAWQGLARHDGAGQGTTENDLRWGKRQTRFALDEEIPGSNPGRRAHEH